jgi:hypothetical protein
MVGAAYPGADSFGTRRLISAAGRRPTLIAAPLNPTARFKIPFMIGVVGHRDLVPDEIPKIRTAVAALLQRLRDDHPDVPLQLLCSMAAGADLLVADVAAELDIGIIALLPYARRLCRNDLEIEADRVNFDRLCELSDVVELNLPDDAKAGDIEREGELRDRQLQRAGSLIARYSGLMIAIWNGANTDYRAGTARAIQFRRMGVVPTDELVVSPRDVLLSPQDDDLNFEIRCSRLSAPSPAAVAVLGFTGGDSSGGEEYPERLRTTLKRLAEFNRDVDEFGEVIARKGRRLSQPRATPIPKTLEYLDRLFTAADWMGSYHRRCFTWALKARYGLWALTAFLLIAFKKESVGKLAIIAIIGVLAVFLLGTLLAIWAHRRSWHRKYLDYRALAEALRVDFYWEVAGVRKEFDGEFAHESFLQKQDVELQWIRNAMRAVSLQLAIHPCGNFAEGFPFVYADWVGDDHPVNGSGQMFYYRQRLHKLSHTVHVSEQIDHALLFCGLILALTFAADVALRTGSHYLLPEHLRSNMLWALALLPVYAAIFEIYLNEKADRALIRQYQYMYSLFAFAAGELRAAGTNDLKLAILRSLGHACLAEHAQWILAHRDKHIQGMRW